MNILLTGASGYIGTLLLAQLKQKECFVRAVSRSPDPSLVLADEVVIENLTPESDFKALLFGIDTVIHLADGFNAFELLPGSVINNEASNRLATTIGLATTAAEQGINFTYLSTVKTMCGTFADHILREDSPVKPQSLYGRLKLKAEQAIIAASQKTGTKAVVLRFPIVFGPGAGGNMEKLLKLVDTPLPLPFHGLASRRSLISSTSLIEAIITIIKQEQTAGGLYLVHDDAVSTTEMIKTIHAGLGRPDRQFKIPPPSLVDRRKTPAYWTQNTSIYAPTGT